ncbi:MAG: hypothetical protein ACQEQ1_06145 [Pseudomonadota bacterium]
MRVTSIRGVRPLLQALAGLAFMLPAVGWGEGVLEWQQWRDYDAPGPATAAEPVSRSGRGLRVGDRQGLGFVWHYQPLRIRSGQPAHNGHLHRVALEAREARGAWQLYASAGIHATSNVLKHQDTHADVWVGRIGLWRDLPGSGGWALGVRGDHRFGTFQWVPALRGGFATGYGQLALDLPRMVQWRSLHGRWSLQAARLGEKWGALDDQRRLESTVRLEEWQLILTRRLDALYRGLGLELGAGMSLDTRVRYREESGQLIRQTLGDRPFLLVRLRW